MSLYSDPENMQSRADTDKNLKAKSWKPNPAKLHTNKIIIPSQINCIFFL